MSTIKNIIIKLETDKSELTDSDYNYLCSNIKSNGFENNFYVLMYCINWQQLYEHPTRLTLYDIIRGTSQFSVAYNGLKQMWCNGDISSIASFQVAVLSAIKEGIHSVGIMNFDDTKGLYEFFKYLFQQITNTDYSIPSDPVIPDMKGLPLSNKLLNYFQKLWQAYHLSQLLKSLLLSNVISDTIRFKKDFCFHILLRHYPATKIRYNLHSSPDKQNVKNILNNHVAQKAFIEEDGRHTYSTDGTYQYSLSDYYSYLPQSCIMYVDMMKIAYIIMHIVRIIQKAPNTSCKADVIYFNYNLYEVHYDIIERNGKLSLLFKSVYPLDSKWQKINGISQSAYNRIVNKQDMPPNYNIAIK